MRKRAQRKSKPIVNEPKHIIQKSKIEIASSRVKPNWWVALSLVGIFCLVLLLNSYFIVTTQTVFNPSGNGFEKYYLSGPDPYYNMRLINQTLYGDNPGHYPFYGVKDPILNYPLGSTGTRAPLLNMVAIGFSQLLTPFMGEIDALGISMQFIPALFGALLIIPVYYMGKMMFNKKAGLIAAFIVAIIPIHLGSGHGSAYSLFDHDSINLFMYFMTFLFFLMSIREKDTKTSILYAIMAGIPLAALSMIWVEARYLYAIIAVYAIVQMVIDIFTSKISNKSFITPSIVLFTGYLVSLPVTAAKPEGLQADLTLFLCLAVAFFGVLYYLFRLRKLPWTLTLPFVFSVGVIALVMLYFVDAISNVVPAFGALSKISEILYGTGIYGSKVSMTIAEANTYAISQTVMSFGPALYWLAWTGFLFVAYYFYKENQRRDYLFVIVIFIIQVWLTGVAGRFLNDLVPWIALLGGWIIFLIIDKIDYKQMFKNIKSAGGGIHGLRRGIKILHVIGILCIGLLVILPNAYLAFDAAIPYNNKDEYFGDLPNGAFGTSSSKESYWINAYSWLSKQDNEIKETTKRPAYISWWDYGFYEAAIGAHPTVADNFQDGIPCAANFHTSTSEEEAIAVWIIRLLDGEERHNAGIITEETSDVLKKYLGTSDALNLTHWIEEKTSSPSYHDPIGEEYDKNLSKLYLVGEQWSENAVYHDGVDLITNRLDDEEITNLYVELQETTGYSIRYYGVEGYDKQIFNIFGFLADKSLLLVASQGDYRPEDDFVEIKYRTQNENLLTYDEVKALSDYELQNDPPVSTEQSFKDAYYETMFYRTYIGLVTQEDDGTKSEPDYQIPCWDMKHFYAEYISPYPEFAYSSGKSAVVIAKYYAGALVNGTVSFLGEPIDAQMIVMENITHYGQEIAVDHDKSDIINGTFDVVVPAGEPVLQIRRYPALQASSFVVKNVTFSGAEGSELAPITEDEAMRKGGDFQRVLNITIDPATIKGIVYKNMDNYESYNITTDEPLSNVGLTIREIATIDPDNPENIEYARSYTPTTNDNGSYSVNNLMPGIYEFFAQINDIYIKAQTMRIYSGTTEFNFSKPKSSTIEGVVYYDNNRNEKYDSGEEITDATVDLVYKANIIETITTDSDGKYSFTDVIPGIIDDIEVNEYTIRAVRLPEYASTETIYPEENKTELLNISIGLAPVTLEGTTEFNGQPVGGIDVQLMPDSTVENNTAVSKTATSVEGTGKFGIGMTPGSYNITVLQTEGSTTVYTYEGYITIDVGVTPDPITISLEKKSATVTGVTSYNGVPIENITIYLNANLTITNNTGITEQTISEPDGSYTVELAPGTYDVIAHKFVEESDLKEGNFTYIYQGELVIQKGETARTLNIALAKEAE